MSENQIDYQTVMVAKPTPADGGRKLEAAGIASRGDSAAPSTQLPTRRGRRRTPASGSTSAKISRDDYASMLQDIAAQAHEAYPDLVQMDERAGHVVIAVNLVMVAKAGDLPPQGADGGKND